jgi:hypothetical protein
MSLSLEVAASGSGNTAQGLDDEHLDGMRRPLAGYQKARATGDNGVPPSHWLQDKLSEPRARHSAVAALVFLGLVGAFQLGGHLSGPGTARTDGRTAPAPPAADKPAVSAWASPMPYPLLPVTPVPIWAGAESPRAQPEPDDVTADTALASSDEIDAGDRSTAEEEATEWAGNTETLLRLGGEALEKDYLRTPREESAWYYYQQVLELDPSNVAATLGMKLIVARYAELTRLVIERGDLDSAQTFIDRGLSMAPRDATLARLQGDVDAARPDLQQRLQALRDGEEQREEEAEGPGNPLQWLVRLFSSGGERREP